MRFLPGRSSRGTLATSVGPKSTVDTRLKEPLALPVPGPRQDGTHQPEASTHPCCPQRGPGTWSIGITWRQTLRPPQPGGVSKADPVLPAVPQSPLGCQLGAHGGAGVPSNLEGGAGELP